MTDRSASQHILHFVFRVELLVCALGLLLLGSAPVWGQDQATNWESSTSALVSDVDARASYVRSSVGEEAHLSEIISLQVNDITLEEALRSIAEKGDLELVYGSHPVLSEKHVTLNLQQVTAQEALREATRGTDLKLVLSPSGQFVLVNQAAANDSPKLKARGVDFKVKPLKIQAVEGAPLYSQDQQQGTITGAVTDSLSGETIPGANVVIAGTQQGSSTGADGQYTISGVEPGTYTLQASFVGYSTKVREGVEVVEGETTEVNFALVESAVALEEVVAIGYGEQQRTQITGAITSVDVADATRVSTAGLQEALQGRVGGVNVTPQDGRPGGQMDMDIRGVSTFGNNNPLFVIDGVPIFHDRDGGGYWGEGGNSNPLASLNPNDIESIEILKDASAAAIYGARAANGVVIVTTKEGQEGAPLFTFNARTGVTAVPDYKFIDMMNSEQFVDFTIEAYENAGMPLPPSVQEPNLSENLSRDTDWQDAAFNPGVIQNYHFGVSGGNETATYAFNGGYLNEEGTLISSGFERYSVRMRGDYDVSESINVGGALNLSRSQWNGLYNPTIDFIQEIVQSAPTQPIYDEDNFGGFAGPDPRYSPVNRDNKVGIFTLLDQETTHDRLVGSTYFEYAILDGLSYRLDASADIRKNGDYVFEPRYDMDNRSNDSADLDESSYINNTYNLDNTLRYNKVLSNVHDISLLAGFSIQESTSRWMSLGISEFPSNETRVVDAGTGNFGVGGSATGWGLISQMGRLNYSYDDTYTLMATIRRDGSSRFGSDRQYGIFPSFSGSWNLHNETFMEDIEAISSLRLRASWGQVGSQSIDNYAARSGIQPGMNYILGEGQQPAPAASFTTMGNSNLKWETTTQTNVGVDLSLVEDRLSLTANYFIKNTDDVLLRVPIATTSGINRDNGPFVNAGSLHNEGVELEVDYRDNLGGLNYSISGNISSVKNEVTALGTGGEPIIHNVIVGWATASMTTITRPGDPMGSFYGYVAEGTFYDQEDVDTHATQPNAAPGDVKFADINGDGVINVEDKTIIGNPFPDFTYGLNMNMDYKGIDLTVFLQGKQGHDIYNLTWADLNTTPQYNNQTTMMLDRWTPENRDTDVPRAIKDDPNNNNRVSTRFVEDGSYIRIQNVQLGYSFSPNLVRSMGLSRMRVHLSAKNLYTFTNYRGYNPEIGELETGARSSLSRGVDLGVYPIPRTIEGGIEVVF